MISPVLHSDWSGVKSHFHLDGSGYGAFEKQDVESQDECAWRVCAGVGRRTLVIHGQWVNA